MRSIFIVGIAKTGSKTYMQLLQDHTDYDIVSELHYLSPRWLRQDVCSRVKAELGGSPRRRDIPRLIKLMYSGTINGTFWSLPTKRHPRPTNNITDLDREDLTRGLSGTDMSYRSIIRTLLVQHAAVCGKAGIGAKFPVHIACVATLLRWFPDCRIINTVRDPRAVFASLIRGDSKTGARAGRASLRKNWLTRFLMLHHSFSASAKLHRTMMASTSQGNYLLARLEDIVRNPESEVSRILAFADAEASGKNFRPQIRGSAYSESHLSGHGFDRGSLDRWRDELSRPTSLMIRGTLRREMKALGYH